MIRDRLLRVARLAVLAVAAAAFVSPPTGRAGPGAHGPGGEHIDAATPATRPPGAAPRFEASTELFELVATLHGGELSMLIDRFESNAPVLGARVEVESGGTTATARFHADHGDYAVDDAALLAVLSRPGEHAVVVSIFAGEDTDLLSGTLAVAGASTPAGGAAHDHDHLVERALWLAAGVTFLVLLVRFGWRAQRRRGAPAGGVQP